MAGKSPLIFETSGTSEIVAALVTRDERLAMTLGPARPWETTPGHSLTPLALPSLIAPPGAGREAALAHAARMLGLDLEPTACPWTYGPSARHAIDREPATRSDAPFLRYERLDAPEESPGEMEATSRRPRQVAIRVYLARARDADAPGEADVIWLPLAALRAAQRGLWLSALLAMEGVALAPSAHAPSTLSLENTLVFTPASAGERQILRACAKYGDTILFPPRLSGRS